MTLQEQSIKIERVWAMPNSETFKIPPIAKLIQEERLPGITIEPFPYQSKVECFDYFSTFKDESADFGLIDPVYSLRQRSECYKEFGVKVTGWHTSAGWTSKVKDEVARIIKPGGKTITFGWNSAGIGLKRGFEQTRILIVCHGGDHNDTICTVERKMQTTLHSIREVKS